MKIGDVVSTQQAMSQDEYKWIVLFPLQFNEQGHIVGGKIFKTTKTSREAHNTAFKIECENESNRVLVVEGKLSEISIGEVFVD